MGIRSDDSAIILILASNLLFTCPATRILLCLKTLFITIPPLNLNGKGNGNAEKYTFRTLRPPKILFTTSGCFLIRRPRVSMPGTLLPQPAAIFMGVFSA